MWSIFGFANTKNYSLRFAYKRGNSPANAEVEGVGFVSKGVGGFLKEHYKYIKNRVFVNRWIKEYIFLLVNKV